MLNVKPDIAQENYRKGVNVNKIRLEKEVIIFPSIKFTLNKKW